MPAAEEKHEYPTVAEELHRKTLLALERLTIRHEKDEIDDWEYYTAIQGIFDTVSGLVPEDVYELMSMDEPKSKGKAKIMKNDEGKTVIIIDQHRDLMRVVNALKGKGYK